jgi:hypothetical protein
MICHLWDSLGTKIFDFHGAPDELTPDLRCCRLEICERLLPILKAREPDSFRILVTGDKNWFVLEYRHSTKWSVVRDKIPTRVSQTIGTKTVMLIVIWGIDGFHVVE